MKVESLLEVVMSFDKAQRSPTRICLCLQVQMRELQVQKQWLLLSLFLCEVLSHLDFQPPSRNDVPLPTPPQPSDNGLINSKPLMQLSSFLSTNVLNSKMYFQVPRGIGTESHSEETSASHLLLLSEDSCLFSPQSSHKNKIRWDK